MYHRPLPTEIKIRRVQSSVFSSVARERVPRIDRGQIAHQKRNTQWFCRWQFTASLRHPGNVDSDAKPNRRAATEDRVDTDLEPVTEPERLSVIIHPVVNERTSPHLVRLTEAFDAEGIDFRRLRATALTGREPVLVHVNWPEHIVRSDGPLAKRLLKQAEAVVITILLLLRPHRVVWTAHNLAPHDGWKGPIERILFWAMCRRMRAVVVLVPGHEQQIVERYPNLVGVPFVPIEWGSVAVSSDSPPARPGVGVPVRLLMVGAIGPYKQQLDVMRWLAPFVESGQATLTLAGPVGDHDYLEQVRAAAPPGGLEVIDRWVSDPELDDIIRSHHAVLAPQENAFNTGVPYVALPAGTPVAMSPSRQADWLIESQGEQWVRVLPDTNDEMAIAQLLAWAALERTGASPGPWDWKPKAQAHREVYLQACS